MIVTPDWRVTFSSLPQSRNAESLMFVTLDGTIMLVRLVQSRNARVPDSGNAGWNRDPRQAAAAIEQRIRDAGDAGWDN